ncbi:unnamed protein product [Scytosiphon promiscuus]
MFDAADFVNLPSEVKAVRHGVSTRKDRATLNEGFREKESDAAATAADAVTVLNPKNCYVIEACAMGGDNVAIAMSNGELCHANLSRTRAIAAEPVPVEERRWPTWSSWKSNSGKVQSLQYDPAHDALVTLELATTAAGDQAFLGRYHRRQAVDGTGKSGVLPSSWIGSSVPLATRHAKVAVCASRGWAAVCTGSVVNLWAVAHSQGDPPNTQRGSPKSREMPIGFEHALSVDLAELIGGTGGMANGGGASHIALFGNVLAVATEHAVFLVNLKFDVKGEVPSRGRSTPPTTLDAPVTPTLPVDDESPKAASPQGRPSRSNPRDKTKRRSGPAVAPKSDPKDFPPRVASRGGLLGRGKGIAGVDEGGKQSTSPGVRKDGGKAKSERRDGIVERAISEADDMVVCLLHPVGGEDDREARGSSAQPPPLLRAFNDDWEALRARTDCSAEQSEFENIPLATDSISISLPVNGNPTVLDRTDGCDVVLARRVGSGEVVKELHILPIPKRNGTCNGEGQGPGSSVQHKADLSTSRYCRFVLLTNKGATVCVVCPTTKTSMAIPMYPASASSQSPATVSSHHVTPPSPGPSKGHEAGRLGAANRPVGQSSSSVGLDVDAAEDLEELVVFLRRSCRFNNDLLLASITGAFMFVLTMEGIEVWTFPSDEAPTVGELEDGSLGRSWTPAMSSCSASPRPCLLHVQKLEVNGELPRSPASCMVSLEGATPRLLLFPSPPDAQVTNLAFLARQCQRRLRSRLVADERVTDDTRNSKRAQPSSNPFATWPPLDTDPNGKINSWELKLDAWRHGFCGLVGSGSRKTIASPLGLLLRLRTSTEAFRLLAEAVGCCPRPLSAAISATLVSAAEGLHGALAAEAIAAWRAAVGTEGSDDNVGQAGIPRTLANCAGGRAVGCQKTGIETVLVGIVNCWRLQGATARCASLLGRLMLEKALSEVKESSVHGSAGAGLTYTRACCWLLASGEPLVESFARLQNVAAHMSAIGAELKRTAVASSVISLDVDEEGNSDSTTTGVPSPDLEDLLPRAMYETFLLPSLGAGNMPESQLPRVTVDASASGTSNGESLSLDDVLKGLVSHLHGEDMRCLAQHRGLRGLWDGVRRSTPLSKAVVYASRVPWTTCPSALSRALAALQEQDRTLDENAWNNISSSSGSSSSSASLSGTKSSPRDAKRRRPGERARQNHSESTEHPRPSPLERRGLVEDVSGELAQGGSITATPREWLAVARAILMGYAEQVEARAAAAVCLEDPAMPSLGGGARNNLAADPRILQLACERHPYLVAPAKIGPGPLARDLLAGGMTQPVVAALVNLTLCDGGIQGAGSCGACFGPHRARELLQLKEDGFSPTIDPLQALRVFGSPGRQIAARLDSLRRVSLDLSGPYGSPTEVRSGHFDGDAYDQSSSASDGRRDRSDTKALSAAARDFLSRRCSASLALAAASARHRERLSETLGAPETWRASFARNRALDRAVLRFLIGAHLDDLRALENPATRNPQTSRSNPVAGSGWGTGLSRTTQSFRTRDRRDRGESSWADAIVPLLSSQVSTTPGGRAEEAEHVDAILCLVREITWRGSRADKDIRSGLGCSISQEEAEEVVTEARRRLPITELAPVSAGNLLDFDNNEDVDHEVQPWGSGVEGIGKRRAPWPWAPRAVPASAVGALLALAAALPPAGKLLAGLDVVLQIGQEVVAAAKAEAAAAAGAVAAASGSVVKGAMRGGHQPLEDDRAKTGGTTASVEEVSRAAERALLLYVGEYCGKDARKWASVTEHVRTTSDEEGEEGEVNELGSSGGVEAAGRKLVRALLRRCGEEFGGKALVRALPERLDLTECLDEIERSLLGDKLDVSATHMDAASFGWSLYDR